MLERVEDYLRTGNLERAEKRIAKAEGEKKPVVENKETEEARIARLIEEGVRKKLEEKGLLQTNELQPSGSSATVDEAYALAAQGKITWAEAKKRGAVFT
jgi:hypothetical protein